MTWITPCPFTEKRHVYNHINFLFCWHRCKPFIVLISGSCLKWHPIWIGEWRGNMRIGLSTRLFTETDTQIYTRMCVHNTRTFSYFKRSKLLLLHTTLHSQLSLLSLLSCVHSFCIFYKTSKQMIILYVFFLPPLCLRTETALLESLLLWVREVIYQRHRVGNGCPAVSQPKQTLG